MFARPAGEARQMIICGIISGAAAQIIFRPVSLVIIYIVNSFTPGNEQTLADTLRWLAEQLTIWFAIGLVISGGLAVLGALAHGFFIKYTQKRPATL